MKSGEVTFLFSGLRPGGMLPPPPPPSRIFLVFLCSAYLRQLCMRQIFFDSSSTVVSQIILTWYSGSFLHLGCKHVHKVEGGSAQRRIRVMAQLGHVPPPPPPLDSKLYTSRHNFQLMPLLSTLITAKCSPQIALKALSEHENLSPMQAPGQ